VGADVLGVVADDPRAAALLGGRSAQPGGLRRTPLMRSARDVAGAICARLAPAQPGPPPFPEAPTPAPAATVRGRGMRGAGL
jgi:hypothetical protein